MTAWGMEEPAETRMRRAVLRQYMRAVRVHASALSAAREAGDEVAAGNHRVALVVLARGARAESGRGM